MLVSSALRREVVGTGMRQAASLPASLSVGHGADNRPRPQGRTQLFREIPVQGTRVSTLAGHRLASLTTGGSRPNPSLTTSWSEGVRSARTLTALGSEGMQALSVLPSPGAWCSASRTSRRTSLNVIRASARRQGTIVPFYYMPRRSLTEPLQLSQLRGHPRRRAPPDLIPCRASR
jgi:hypothetical protein